MYAYSQVKQTFWRSEDALPSASAVPLTVLAAFLSVPYSSTRTWLGFTRPESNTLDSVHTDSTDSNSGGQGATRTEQPLWPPAHT